MKNINWLLFLIVLIYSCNTASNDSYSSPPGASDYQEAKMTVAEREAGYPLEFITIDGTFREALVGGDFVLKGTIKNNATSVTYKDITVEINYYSKTNSLVGTERKTFYEYIGPGGSFDFKEKVWAPDGAASVGLDVVNASSK